MFIHIYGFFDRLGFRLSDTQHNLYTYTIIILLYKVLQNLYLFNKIHETQCIDGSPMLESLIQFIEIAFIDSRSYRDYPLNIDFIDIAVLLTIVINAALYCVSRIPDAVLRVTMVLTWLRVNSVELNFLSLFIL